MNVLICGSKALNISGISDAISPRYIRKNPRSMYARVPHMIAEFFLKIEKLSHIIGTAPILEMARAYGLRPRLSLLVSTVFVKVVLGLPLFLLPAGVQLRATLGILFSDIRKTCPSHLSRRFLISRSILVHPVFWYRSLLEILLGQKML